MIQLIVGRMVRFESQERLGMSVLIKWGQHCDMCRNTHLQGGGDVPCHGPQGSSGFRPVSCRPDLQPPDLLSFMHKILQAKPHALGHGTPF